MSDNHGHHSDEPVEIIAENSVQDKVLIGVAIAALLLLTWNGFHWAFVGS